jgi:DNA polymerase (family X)
MTNYEISDQFSLLSKLSDIHGEDPFKVKQYSIAAYNIERILDPIATMDAKTLSTMKGIGASTSKKITECLSLGQIAALTELIEKTPAGILEMMQIKGLGPKKIVTIWKELEIETVGELLYACNENRLLLFKGFGAKNQQSIQEAIEFYLDAKGSFLYSQVSEIEPIISNLLIQIFGESTVRITGAYRRHIEIIDQLEYVINSPKQMVLEKLLANEEFNYISESDNHIIYKLNGVPLKICLYYGENEFRNQQLFETSASLDFIEKFKNDFPNVDYKVSAIKEDENIFEQAGIQYIPSFLRETTAIIEIAKQHKIPKLIQTKDIKGIIHNHSNWSDGENTIEEMALHCIKNGYEYLVISDHSKSAFYANGLSEEKIKEQHILIDQLNTKLAPFRIFKSIECDILNDGSLDYSDSILSTFDLVIASVHSNLKMNQEKAMQRIITAIENPYTTILGHLSGRLLLSRPPYPLDYDMVVEACVENNVVIELNAHPSRLDMDWRYIKKALDNDVMISINPDAHHIDGFEVIKYGVLAAQKAMVQPQQNLSSFGLQEFESYLFEVRNSKGFGGVST